MALQLKRTFLFVVVVLCTTCTFAVDPDKGKFSCATDADCGKDFECRSQATGGGFCFKVGTCTAEVCDSLDNDCDGLVDEDFNLQIDVANCGVCGHGCLAGAACRASACVETACGDGADNDGDGRTDCADPHCAGLSCSSEPGSNCGTRFPPDTSMDGGADAGDVMDGGADAGDTADGGADAGADAGLGPACVPREAVCDDGRDNDGDGKVDCQDSDCNAQTCSPGRVCTDGACPG